MSDDTSRERARQVAHELCIRERDDDVLLCAGGHMDGRHSTLCDAVTDALLAFADAAVLAENEACERIAHQPPWPSLAIADAIAARRRNR